MLHDSKIYVERALLSSELNTLTRLLDRVAESGRRSRDFTLNDLRRVVVEVVACFRVYRTYLRPGDDGLRPRPRLHRAGRRPRPAPAADGRPARLRLRPRRPPDEPPARPRRRGARASGSGSPSGSSRRPARCRRRGWRTRRSTASSRSLSLNEVGGDPSRFGNSPSAFHALNSHRLADWPGGLSTTATHDTKRGEDGRIRINVISELTDEWKTRLARWSRWNARKKTTVNEAECPDAREEYLLYQTLLGAWPFGGPDDAAPEGFVERVQGYMVKAACEAKRNTTWTDPDPTYKETLSRYVADILEGPDAAPFLNDFLPFQRRVARVGVVHSLAQTLLKLASPGVADVYQGCELWDFSMVDPDNRRPVDFDGARRAPRPDQRRPRVGPPRAELARELLRLARGRRDQALRRLDPAEPPPGEPRPLPPRRVPARRGVGRPEGPRRRLLAVATRARTSWPSPPAWSPP